MNELKEAQDFIKKWGIESDNYITTNIKYSMNGGNPTDNSVELHRDHQAELETVVEAGLKTIPQDLRVGKGEPSADVLLAEIGENPLISIEQTICASSKDWGLNFRDAWVYGIVVGWDEPSLNELQKKHSWYDETVARLKRLHSLYKLLASKTVNVEVKTSTNEL